MIPNTVTSPAPKQVRGISRQEASVSSERSRLKLHMGKGWILPNCCLEPCIDWGQKETTLQKSLVTDFESGGPSCLLQAWIRNPGTPSPI